MTKDPTVIEILTIGREILDGRVIDTNSIFLAEKLKQKGLTPHFGQRVDDDVLRIKQAFEIAANRSSLILVTGGLGPTADDLTTRIFAEFVGSPYVLFQEALEQVRAYFKRENRDMLETQIKQAYFPQGAKVLPNPVGTAPGFSYFDEKTSTQWYFLPGIPREMAAIFNEQVLPELPLRPNAERYFWATQFTSEGELQKRLEKVMSKIPANFELAFRTRSPENHISLYADSSIESDRLLFKKLVDEITALLGNDVFSKGEALEELEEVVIRIAREKKFTLGAVESCTGGLVSTRLTDVSGSSEAFLGGWITYDNLAKLDLGVSEKTLEKWGAVSPQVALEMAQAGLRKLEKYSKGHTQLCVSTTGIAGPGGGSLEKPVGLCHLGLACSDGSSEVHCYKGRSNQTREALRKAFSQQALNLIRKKILPII